MSYESWHPVTTETRLSFPLNGTVYTTTLRVSAERLLPAIGSSMSELLGAAWADSLIISAAFVPESGSGKTLTVVHARIPSEEQQLASNWEYSTCSIGGQQFPSVQRTVILPASAVQPEQPLLASAMPLAPGQTFSDYILVERQVSRSGMDIEPVFRVERRQYVKRSITRQVGVDPVMGGTLLSSTRIYHATEVVSGGNTAESVFLNPSLHFGLSSGGTQVTGTQLSCAWYSIETTQVVGALASSYTTNENYYWPPVLEKLELLRWTRRDGGVDIYPRAVFRTDGYHGPCKTTVTRSWSATLPGVAVPEQMVPTPVHYACPFFTLSIPACLHGVVTAECDIGNTDSTYTQNSLSTRQVPATNYTEWPEDITFEDVEPFRGGFLKTSRTIYRPPLPALPTP